MKSIRLMAMVMILLVVALPVAFAQQLDVTRFSGRDEVDELVRPAGDTLVIVVEAELRGNPSPAVARTRLKVAHAGTEEYFTSCTSLSDSLYECRYESTNIISSGSEEYEIILLDQENNQLKSTKKVLSVDKTPPSIIQYSVSPKTSRTGDMEIEYLVEDYGKRVGDSSACSGIKEIKITADGTTIKTVSYDKSKICDSEEQKINYKYSTSDKFVGLDVCIVAKDYFGQESAVNCESYSIDNSPPRIQSVEFRDSKGYAVSHIKTGQKVNVDMLVAIENEGDLAIAGVKADLSKLNPSLKEVKAEEGSGDIFVWRDIEITSPSTCEVKISAKDKIGNNATTALTCTLPVDDEGPVPTSIYASAADLNGTPLIGVNGTIFVDFTEEGAGMDKGNAFMDLHNIGLGTVVQADECIDQGAGVWRCAWQVVPTVSSGIHKVTVLEGTSDDLGNFGSQVSENVIVDTKPPKISSVDITYIHENADYGPNTVYGDTIEFLFNVSDVMEGYANLSMVGGNYSPAVECTGKSCLFSVYVDVSGPLNATISFDFFDIARNKETYDYSFMVYGVLLNDTQTNYWKSKVKCSPRLVDRQSAEIYNHPVYCHVKLTPNNPNAKPVFVKPGDLGMCEGNFEGYVVDMEVINNKMGSTDPYIVLTLAAAPFEINELKMTCPVFISTSVGEFFSPSVEMENVSIKVNFYNLPYGELYSNTEQEIQHTMRNAVEWADWIGDIEEYMEILRSMCNTKTAFNSVLGAFEAVINLLGIAGMAATLIDGDACKSLISLAKKLCNNAKSPIERLLTGDPAGTPAKKKLDLSWAGLFNLLDLACKAANCQLSSENAKQYEDDNKILVTASAVFGGGLSADVCRRYKEFVMGGGGLGEASGGVLDIVDYDKLISENDYGDTSSPVDIKESIVGSVACMCLPGISYNLEKIRQINCGYAYCLGKRVLEEGIPRSYCANEKAFLTCNYVTGQIFEIVPFAALVDRYAGIIQEAYANPISVVTMVSALICGGNSGRGGFYDYCAPRGGGGEKESCALDGVDIAMYVACSIPKTAAKVMDAYASYKLSEEAGYGLKPVSNDYCEMAEELIE